MVRGNVRDNSPPWEGWQAKPDGVGRENFYEQTTIPPSVGGGSEPLGELTEGVMRNSKLRQTLALGATLGSTLRQAQEP